MKKDVLVPNIGDFHDVEVIEIIITEGKKLEKGVFSNIIIPINRYKLNIPECGRRKLYVGFILMSP